jgi:hypothetical protein
MYGPGRHQTFLNCWPTQITSTLLRHPHTSNNIVWPYCLTLIAYAATQQSLNGLSISVKWHAQTEAFYFFPLRSGSSLVFLSFALRPKPFLPFLCA